MNWKKLKFWHQERQLITAEEFNQCMLDVHSILRKITALYDKHPEMRERIEKTAGMSMEQVVGTFEDMMRMVDMHKAQLDENYREQMTDAVELIAKRMEKLLKTMQK
jgi:predicted urease superfamily metal-dependent hydrolase